MAIVAAPICNRSASWRCERPRLFMSDWYALACSIGFRSSRRAVFHELVLQQVLGGRLAR